MTEHVCRGCGIGFRREQVAKTRPPRYCTRECALRTRNARSPHYSKSKLFAVWSSMIQRCENSNHPAYRLYGALGVRVCAEWRASFQRFAADVGDPAPGMTLDRHPDKNGNYEPGNVRWATRAQQSHNLRTTKLDDAAVAAIRELAGKVRNCDLADRFGVSRSLVSMVIHNKVWRAS